MFVIGGDDFVAGRERQTVADDIGALGGVAGEGDFARGGVDDASGLGFDLSPALVVLQVSAGIGFALVNGGLYSVYCGFWAQAEGAGIEVY